MAMRGLLFEIEGNWAHFKKPETNNNPLTHDFITKTALIGLIGAVLGIERTKMRPLFPPLSNALVYGVQIVNAVKKESWAFKLRYATNQYEKRPVQMEFLKNPRFTVALALRDESEAQKQFDDFASAVKSSEARFTPVLGLHNCPANLRYLSEGEFTSSVGEFQTKSFVTANQTLLRLAGTEQFRIGVDRMPTFQNDDWWNRPEKYVGVLYPSEGNALSARGEHYTHTDGSKWVLI